MIVNIVVWKYSCTNRIDEKCIISTRNYNLMLTHMNV